LSLVSSIRANRITNDYNTGARCLRDYLRYAEACSMGDSASADLVLGGFGATRARVSSAVHPVAMGLAVAIERAGFGVARDVGTSSFRLPLAVRGADGRYILGIALDDGEDSAEETWVLRPALLRAFGWPVVVVPTLDWFRDSASVVERVLGLLRS
jgi:hypothetical protein